MKLIFFCSCLITLLLLSCGNDEDNNSNNPCDPIYFTPVEGVSESNFVIQAFNEPDERGYLITALITNDNIQSVSGSPSFVFRENGENITYSTSNTASSTSCLTIEAESSCDFEFRIYFDQTRNVDNNISFLCFYYSLY